MFKDLTDLKYVIQISNLNATCNWDDSSTILAIEMVSCNCKGTKGLIWSRANDLHPPDMATFEITMAQEMEVIMVMEIIVIISKLKQGWWKWWNTTSIVIVQNWTITTVYKNVHNKLLCALIDSAWLFHTWACQSALDLPRPFTLLGDSLKTWSWPMGMKMIIT